MTVVAEQRGHVDTADGVRLAWRRTGNGDPAIIVLHGGPGFTMDYLADDLMPLAQRHAVVFYDQRGSGGSTLVTAPQALDARCFADDLEAVRRHFGLDRPTLLGHSWGAGVAALYAMRFPQHVGRMILVDAIPLRGAALQQAFARIHDGGDDAWRLQLRERSAAWRADPGNASACRAYYDTWFTPFFVDPAAMRRSRGDFCAGGAGSLRNKIESVDRFVLSSLGDYDWRAGLSKVPAPSLVVHGRADPIAVEYAAEWAAALPDARLHVLDGVGHFPYLEAPDAFFGALECFMRGEWPGGARLQ